MAYIFVVEPDSMGLSSFIFCGGLRKTHLFWNRMRIGRSRSSEVVDFGTNRKGVCDFLLVINSNFGPILHRFWDTASYWLKIGNFSYPTLVRCPRSGGTRQNFWMKLNRAKTRGMGLLYEDGSRLIWILSRVGTIYIGDIYISDRIFSIFSKLDIFHIFSTLLYYLM